MNAAEALMIVNFVQEACPAQKFSEYTPDIWTELLADVDFTDSRAALVELGKRLSFIGPPEIRTEVRRIRARRLEVDFEDIPELDAVADDPIAYQRTLKSYRARVASGWQRPAMEKQQQRRPIEKLLKDTVESLPAVPKIKDGEIVLPVRGHCGRETA